MLKAIARFFRIAVETDCGALIDERRRVCATLTTRSERSVAREWMGE